MSANPFSQATQHEHDARALRNLHTCLGYVQDGSDTTVSISQDDATRTYHVTVGRDSPHSIKPRKYWGNSLVEALEKAAAGEG